jgi:predicted metal-dependent hydrolase
VSSPGEQHGPDDVADARPDVPFAVEVVRSARRRRTVGAQLRGGVLRVTVPGWMSADQERQWVERMTASFRRRTSAERLDLPRRAARLAAQYGLPAPSQVTWSDAMTARWGSCSPQRRSIALSTRLAPFPDWVVDSVIVHELCHLVEPDHGPGFWALANRYPRMERAIGYLIAKADDVDDDGHDVIDEPAEA